MHINLHRWKHYFRFIVASELGENSNVTAVEKKRRNTTTKLSKSEMKQDRVTFLGNLVEKNGEIRNEINGRRRKTLQFYHLIRSI